MKRFNNLYPIICSKENLYLADTIARKGKSSQYGIKVFDKNKDANIERIHQELINKTYKTSEYTTMTIWEPKERLIFRLPYRDRVVHHAIMNPLEPIFTGIFTADTFSGIKGQGHSWRL